MSDYIKPLEVLDDIKAQLENGPDPQAALKYYMIEHGVIEDDVKEMTRGAAFAGASFLIEKVGEIDEFDPGKMFAAIAGVIETVSVVSYLTGHKNGRSFLK